MTNLNQQQDGLSGDAFFQTVFQASPDAAILTRVCDGEIIHVNESFCRITGYTPNEVIGKTTIELLLYANLADRNAFIDYMSERSILDPKPFEFRRKDGTLRSGLVSARSFCSHGYEYVCGSIQDITEHLRLERENNARAEELRRLFETMAQGVVYQDAEGRIVSSNPAAERMLGLSKEELLQRTSLTPDWDTVREDGSPLPASETPSMIALRTGKPFGPSTLGVYNAKIKDHIWLSVSATPLFHEGEQTPYQAYVILEDITAQRKAQKNYQLLFQEMVDGFALHEIICSEDGRPQDYRYLAVNPAFERMTGLCGNDLVGKTVLEVLPETEQYWIDTYGQVALTGTPVTFQNYAASLDKYFSVTAYRPAPMQFACTFSDVTQHVRHQKEQERAKEQINRLAHICDVAPCSILVHDKEGNLLYANEYSCRLHGFAKSELMEKSLHEFMGEPSNEGIMRYYETIQQTGERVIQRLVHTKDGRQIPLLVNAKKIIWEGSPAILSIGTDITERQQSERTLERSLAQNRRILENLQDAYFQSTFEGDFLMLNPRATQMFGYASVEEMMQHKAISLYAHPEDRAAMYEKLKEDGRVTSHTCQLKRKDGSIFWGSMHVQFLKSESGEVIGAEGLIRDINERRKLENEVKEQHESIRATNEVLKRRLEQSINAISKIGELRDAYTAGHQHRVQQLACEIGLRCGMTQEALTSLSYGALVHDIGKIYIASDILNKPGKITNLEYQILQTHVEYSYSVVLEMGLPQEILTMVQQHHERLDGTGYPNKCVGDEIIFESRILGVADVVEAMTSHRPYRPALGIDKALAEIEAGKGVKYDATVVDICLSLFREEGFQFAAEQNQE